MANLQQIFPFNNALVRKFLNWRQGDEEDTWRNKAVETLIKKLRREEDGQYANLQSVLQHKSEETPCITLARSQDGRVQVSHRKMLPHVMYCRIFRWPDLQSQHELRSLPVCQYPFGRRDQSKICVNPYHYVRADQPLYPPVVTPRSTEFANASPPESPLSPVSSYSQQQPLGSTYYPNQSPESVWMQHSPPPSYCSRDVVAESQEQWVKISYAELNTKIGGVFQSGAQTVTVDGFTQPSSNYRFSLGVLSNINRNSTIELTRRAIRRGISLENNDNQIFVNNLSETSIFFHSKNCNVENQLNQFAVVKIEPQGRQKIFDFKVFDDLVQEALRAEGKAYERLYALTEHCHIKLSFVKGWGSIYQRQDVTSTPCWIEISLLKAMATLDKYLPSTQGPESQITSTS